MTTAKNASVDEFQIAVYFDGLCHLCSREVNHYRGMRGSEKIRFVDITGAEFDAAKEGLDPKKVHQTMHVKDGEGRLYLGVDAFIRIWQELPALRFLAPAARAQPLHLILKGAYAIFAKIRPMLPRKSCEDSPYCEMPKKPTH